MCTRATFQFPANLPETPEITLFVTHDGYPAGAAVHLRAMLQAGGLVAGNVFFRVSPHAVIVAGHGAYANTSYRYSLTRTMQIQVERRRVHGRDEWEEVYLGELLAFVNAQPGPCLYAVTLGGLERVSYLTLAEMCQELAQARAALQRLESGEVAPLGRHSLSQARAGVESLKRQVRTAAHRESRAGRLGWEGRLAA